VQSPSAMFLGVLCVTAIAAAQRPGVTSAGRVAPQGFQRGTSLPLNAFANPYLISDLTFAQRLGATVAGSSNGLPAFWGPWRFGAGFFPGWNGSFRFGAPDFFPLCARGDNAFGFGGPELFGNPAFTGGFPATDYYPPAPSNLPVIAARPFVSEWPSPLSISPLHPIQEPEFPAERQEIAPQAFRIDDRRDSSFEEYGIRAYHAPDRLPIPESDHPLMIALKNGWFYTAKSYWVKNQTFHFITTHGDHIRVNVNMLDRLYPPLKQHNSSDTNSRSVDNSLH
jgi:hypothetical protein